MDIFVISSNGVVILVRIPDVLILCLGAPAAVFHRTEVILGELPLERRITLPRAEQPRLEDTDLGWIRTEHLAPETINLTPPFLYILHFTFFPLRRAFPTYLDGAALLWFSKLPAGLISSFEELAKSFIDYFAAARIYVHGSDYLGTIRQGPQESLKDYLTRFAEATMEIPDLDPAVHLHALKAGLRPGKFRETITITKPKTLEEFRERAAGQMEIEELCEANRTERKPRREEDRMPRSANNKELGKLKLTPKFDNYTRFNTKREKIIKEILNAKIIKSPARAGSYQHQRFVDKSKHCAFHQKYGHTTDECVIAKDLLERLARQGLLDKYIEGRKHKEGG
ncbi:uncharacterized protein LOC107647554 [Arachis ipaensis]|uniref:uncharacterized protein LOC107647554 n=1 Tax=Arachis ipaensis TaxID=130454 RepID=UPI0007AFDE8F|nr:uncharacterized protein LOC107647554 [Arachis ipaensis]XP_025662063.1 uncharacterized protein LOC112757722 [Arachis hypogaea]